MENVKRLGCALLLALALSLAQSQGAVAKTGMRAWLMSSIPRWAEPGAVVNVKWIVRDGEGHSFNAIGVFIRFTSGAFGVAPNEGFGTPNAHPTGEYEADVTVPQGGIGRIEFGIAGTMSGPNMPARRSDGIFPVANLKWTPTEAVPDGTLPPPDSVTNRVTSTSPTSGAVLLTSIPLKAPEGVPFRVMWRVRAADGRYDHGSVGMFVRLLGREDGTATEAFASPTGDVDQPYEAEVVVPRGGIWKVEFGIMGNASGQRSDRLFPLVDVAYTVDEIKPAYPPAALPPSDLDRSRQYLALIVIAVAAALALVVALYAHEIRKQPMEVVDAGLAGG